MTREEAKDYIREWCPYDRQEEIIKALNNSDEDCISRAKALKEMQIYHDDCAKTSKYTRLGFETAMNIVESLPSIQPKTKTDVFNKIRAEILKIDDINPDYPMDRTIHISRNEVLEIIDKYKAESEEV